MSVVSFEQAMAEGRISDARSILRGLISSNSSDSALPAAPVDLYELHARLDPKGVPLQLLTADFSGQPVQLQEAQALFRLNGQDDLALLTGLAAGKLTMEAYRECLAQDLARGYGGEGDACKESYSLGYPNCLEPRDFISALETSNTELLRDLLYDGISRSWDHSFPDYDYFLSELARCLKVVEDSIPPTGQRPLPGPGTPMVRFGLSSLLDVPLCVALLEGCSNMFQVHSFSPVQIALGLLRSVADQRPASVSPLEILASMPPGQRSTMVNSLYFSGIRPKAERLDCSAQVLEFASLFGALLEDLILILPPLSLSKHHRAFTACPAFFRHYPLPFLSEAPALHQVLEAWEATATAMASIAPQRVIQLPDRLLTMSSADAFRTLQNVLRGPEHPNREPSELFVRSWQILQFALDEPI
jgi:hypothetical protein